MVILFHCSRKHQSGGLGDRLRGLVSAIALSQVLNRELIIDCQTPDISSLVDIQFTGKHLEEMKNADYIKGDYIPPEQRQILSTTNLPFGGESPYTLACLTCENNRA